MLKINEPVSDETLPEISHSPIKMPVSITVGDGVQHTLSQNRSLGDHLASMQVELVVDVRTMVGNEMDFFQRPKLNICALVRTLHPSLPKDPS